MNLISDADRRELRLWASGQHYHHPNYRAAQLVTALLVHAAELERVNRALAQRLAAPDGEGHDGNTNQGESE